LRYGQDVPSSFIHVQDKEYILTVLPASFGSVGDKESMEDLSCPPFKHIYKADPEPFGVAARRLLTLFCLGML